MMTRLQSVAVVSSDVDHITKIHSNFFLVEVVPKTENIQKLRVCVCAQVRLNTLEETNVPAPQKSGFWKLTLNCCDSVSVFPGM
jgi:hypothetical protein